MLMPLELIENFGVKGFSYDPHTKLTHIVRDDVSGSYDAMKGALQCMATVDISHGFNRDQVEAYTLTVKNAAKRFLEEFLPGTSTVKISDVQHPSGRNYKSEACIDLVLAHPLESSHGPSWDRSLSDTKVLPVSKLVAPVRDSDYAPVMRV